MENAKKIQNLFNFKGYKMYACGGFVRDTLLGIEPKDIDLATQATPEQAIKILEDANIKVIPTGLQHGTVTAVLDGENYEITTFRRDTNCDGRHAEVAYTDSLEEDSNRRDFTINALYMDLDTGEILDFHGGEKDLSNNLLRFVGHAPERIHEDYLRMLRYLRFTAKHGFKQNPNDRTAVLNMFDYIQFVSTERIRDELSKLICLPNIDFVIGRDIKIDLILFPELKILINHNKSGNLWETVCKKLKKLNTYVQDPIVSLTFIFVFSSSPLSHHSRLRKKELRKKIFEKFLYRMKFSGDEIKRANFLLENHGKIRSDLNKSEIRKLISICDDFGNKYEFINLIHLARAFKGSLSYNASNFITTCRLEDLEEEARDEIEKFIKPVSPLNGNDLISLGFPKGPILSEIKNFLKDKILKNELSLNNSKDAVEILKKTPKYNLFLQ